MKSLGWRMANLKQHRVALVAVKGLRAHLTSGFDRRCRPPSWEWQLGLSRLRLIQQAFRFARRRAVSTSTRSVQFLLRFRAKMEALVAFTWALDDGRSSSVPAWVWTLASFNPQGQASTRRSAD